MLRNQLTRDTTAVILAGGSGSRVFPLTRDRGKPGLPLAGKFRLIDIPLSNCLNSGIGRVFVFTQSLAQSTNRHVHNGWAPLFPAGRDNFIEVVPPQQKMGKRWYEGTADSVLQNINLIGQDNPKYILILSADHIYNMNYMDMVEAHVLSGADVTIASIPIPVDQAKHFGILETDSKYQVKKFREKPKGKVKEISNFPGQAMASMGIYVWSSRALVAALENCIHVQRDEHDFGKHVIPEVLESGMKVFSYPFVDEEMKPLFWADVGRFKSYYDVHMDFMGLNPGFNFYDENWPIHTAPRNLPSAKTALSAVVENGSMVSDGCIIDLAHLDRTVLSPNVRVGKNVVIENSIIFDNVQIGDGALIRNAIIDKHNIIPANAVITPEFVTGFDLDPDYLVEDGIIVIPKRVIPWVGWIDPAIQRVAK